MLVVGALGHVSSYDGGVQAVSDVSLSMTIPNDPGSRASQETVFRNASSNDSQRASSSIRCV